MGFWRNPPYQFFDGDIDDIGELLSGFGGVQGSFIHQLTRRGIKWLNLQVTAYHSERWRLPDLSSSDKVRLV